MSFPLSVLDGYYPVVVTLDAYLQRLLCPTTDHASLLQPSDFEGYRSLLESSYVAMQTAIKDRSVRVVSPMSHMREVSVASILREIFQS